MTQEKPQPSRTEVAILKTLLYGDVFDYPLTLREIHHFMIDEPATLDNVQETLDSSDWLARHIVRHNGYYAMRPEAADLRHYRAEVSEKLWKSAWRYGVWMTYFPFVRMVALTGALAMRNASSERDDIDYLIVTAPGRVWFTRLLAVMLVRLARLWGVELCPNYVLSDCQLEQQRRNLYIAHELAQMVPVSGHELYERMRAANGWANAMMPNANGVFQTIEPHSPRGVGRWLQRGLERLFSGHLGDWIDNWERRRKAQKFTAQAKENPHSSAVISPDQVKGHFHDYGHPILRQFHENLSAYGITPDE